MQIELRYIKTDADGTVALNQVNGSDIKRIVRLEDTVGDEQHIKSGELILENIDGFDLQVGGAPNHWMALYLDGALYNVYKYPSLDETDDRTGMKRWKLEPLQRFFYDLLNSLGLGYETTTGWWATGLEGSAYNIDQITVLNGTGAPQGRNDATWFSLAKIIENLSGKHNDLGFEIDTVSHEITAPDDADSVFIWRGRSTDWSDTDANKVNQLGDSGNLTWLEVFKIIVAGYNSFVRVAPKIGTKLQVDIEFVPRVSLSVASPIATVKWITRKRVAGKYFKPGGRVTGNNFNYPLSSGHELDIPVSDPDQNDAGFTDNLFLATGHIDGGLGKWVQDDPFFSSGIPDPYYVSGADFDGIEAKVKANYGSALLRPLDQIEVDGVTDMQINTIRIEQDGTATIEGPLV